MIDGTSAVRTQPRANSSLDTLDEPVYKTLLRDLQRVGYKLFHVLVPRGQGTAALRDCETTDPQTIFIVLNRYQNLGDLWGPLLLCLLLASTLASEARDTQAPLVFATVFVIVWVGAGVVTVNALLLGGTISFFQSVCVLGYCVAPLVIAAVVCKYLLETVFTLKFVVIFASYLWATTASVGFLAALVPEKRKLLATYPVGLFYLVMAWMILVQ